MAERTHPPTVDALTTGWACPHCGQPVTGATAALCADRDQWRQRAEARLAAGVQVADALQLLCLYSGPPPVTAWQMALEALDAWQAVLVVEEGSDG